MSVDEISTDDARVDSTVANEAATPPRVDQSPSVAVWVTADAAAAASVERSDATFIVILKASDQEPDGSFVPARDF